MARYLTPALLLLLASAGMARGADPHALDPIIQGLVDRSRLLRDTHFRIPLSVYSQYLADKSQGLPGPPAPVACILEEGFYDLKVAKDGQVQLHVSMRITGLADNPPPLAVLSSQMAWEDVRIDGKPAELAARDGWLWLQPSKGRSSLTASACLLELDRRGGDIDTPIARSVRTQVRLESTEAWELASANSSFKIRGDDKGTHGALALTARDRLHLSLAPPREEVQHPPRYQISGNVAWNFDAGCQQLLARLSVKIVGGATDRLDLTLPPGAGRVEIRGPDVRDCHISGNQAAVFLRGKVRERTELTLRCELPATGGLRVLGLADGAWEDGSLAVTNSAGGSELLASAVSGLREEGAGDLPAQTATMLAGPPALVYRITGRSFSAAVEAVDLGEFALKESIADLAHYELLLRQDGEIMCKASYEVRNRNKQFVRLSLPRNSQVLLARVNEEPCPITPAGDAADAYLLPLVRSRSSIQGLVSFPVEVVYLCRTAAMQPRGQAAMPLPRIDLPIAYAWCQAYVPEEIAASAWSGPLRKVAEFSSQTARASLSYGRGTLAEGYAESSRPAPKAHPSPQGGSHGLQLLVPPKAAMNVPPPLEQPPPRIVPQSGTVALEVAKNRVAGSDGKAMAGALGANYYRAGKEFYDRNDYANAAAALKKTIELSPGSNEALNAGKLLVNIKVLRGEKELQNKQEQMAGQVVRSETEANLKGLADRQRQYLAEGEELARKGQPDEAKAKLQAVRGLGDELVQGGQRQSEQTKVQEVAVKKLRELEDQDRSRAEEARREVAKLKASGEYKRAFAVSNSTMALSPQDAEMRKQSEELAILAAKQETEKLTSRYGVGSLPSAKKKAHSAAAPVPMALPQPVVKPAPVTEQEFDVRDLVYTDGSATKPAGQAGDGWSVEEFNARKSQDVAKLREQINDVAAALGPALVEVQETNGRLMIRGTGEQQLAARQVLDNLRAARGPRVQLGQRLAGQQAEGQGRLVISGNNTYAGTTTVNGGTVELSQADRPLVVDKDSDALQDFISRNYNWEMSQSGGGGGGGRMPGQTRKLAEKLAYNRGQKIVVASRNINTDRSGAESVGVRFVIGNNGTAFSVADEAQVRTLLELSQRNGGNAALANLGGQETIIGTDALLANGMTANATFAADTGNTLNINDNPVSLPHDRYILISNGGYLTAVRAGAMQFWTEKPQEVKFAEVPQTLDLPRAGREVRFEKILVEPSDELVIRADYTRKGN